MKRALQGTVAALALGGLVLASSGCDECVDYCLTVADCYEQHMEVTWEELGYDDYEDFLDKCDDVYFGQNRISQAGCRVAKRQYECDEDSYQSW